MQGSTPRVAKRPQRPTWLTDAPRFILLLILALIFLAPIYWMLSTSFKPESDAIATPIQWLPARPTLDNYTEIFNSPDGNLWRWTFNSVFTAVAFTLAHLVLCVLTAYPLARLKFKGRETWFWIILSSLMVPGIVTLIPSYIMMLQFNWIDTYHALIWPGVAGVFGVFLLRQFFVGIPFELEEAARMDGASELTIWRKIMLPLTLPTIAAFSILQFVAFWNTFLWPIIVIGSERQLYPLSAGLLDLSGAFASNTRAVSAGAVIATIPIIIVFLFFQRYFMRGLEGAVKG